MKHQSSNRLLIVSNRLPVTASAVRGTVRLSPAHGGLATGLRPWHEHAGGQWIGWPGDVSALDVAQREALDRQLRDQSIIPVHLSADDIERYYNGFSNRVLWPLFHYLIDRVPVDAVGWDAYRAVNGTFADAVAMEYRAGDTIWVHDYQLMLLPALLRERLPEARIGFFLHIPFPSSEIFRTLPWRREILAGLLGADLVGFHTFAYLRHFVASLLHVDGVETDIDRIRINDRYVQLGVFPMGVDAGSFAALARDPSVIEQAAAIQREAGGRQIVLGVDRLDYTKGIPRRLEAIERLLLQDRGLADRMRFIQVAVPSRGDVDAYRRFKRHVEERVGGINGALGGLGSAPVHYVHRSLPTHELAALYCAADVMLVTPLRDGMNLVAKEFVASRVDEGGVLVLSEFAGAAAELNGAVVVNPYDVDAVAAAIRRGLSMPARERRSRMRILRQRVTAHDIHAWASGFLSRLQTSSSASETVGSAPPEPPFVAAVIDALSAGPLRLLLDYDGTLVPLARSPELAAPDAEVVDLLAQLSACEGVEVDVVSGRPYHTLEPWLGHLPVGLWAEHGFWHRPRSSGSWQPAANITPHWMARIRPILDQFTASTPGSHVEVKTASLAWHYRRAEREFGSRQAHELRMLLGDILSNQPFEVLEGKKVIEVRVRGVSKAVVAHRIQAEALADTTVIAIGDDRTDEELFRMLPESSVTVTVGKDATGARFRVNDYRAVRELLRTIVRNRSSIAPSSPARDRPARKTIGPATA